VRVVLVRASDVPTYVQHGGADLGVAGLDVLLEHGSHGLYRPLDLKIARCRMSVAVRADFDYAAAVRRARASAWPPSTRRSRASTSPPRACTWT
jgi:ATP phosphoribosyltransferase